MSSEWRTFRIQDIAAEMGDAPFGSNLKTHDYTESGALVVQGKNIQGRSCDWSDRRYVTIEKYQQLVRNPCREGDLVFPKVGTIGKVGILTPASGINHYILSTNTMRLRVNNQLACRDFVYYYFSWPRTSALINSINANSVQPVFNFTSLKNFEITLPPIEKQKHISNFLCSLDDRIALLRETNATLEAIAQALFKSWFVDFDPVHAKARGETPQGMDDATAALFPDSFEESELGMIPKGWKMKTMDDISIVGIGKTPPRKEPQWFSECSMDIPWVSIKDMGNAGAFINQTSEFLTREAVDKFNVRYVPDNTVILSFKLTVGRLSITDGVVTTNEAIAHFRTNENSPLTSEYIYFSLKSFNFDTLSSTSSIANAVNSKTVKSLPVLVPTAKVVSAFQFQVGT
ncbi:MAG: restriction endonuclease subunit S, partial [Aeromonadaceae bacterium]